jgi:hypothetical protein
MFQGDTWIFAVPDPAVVGIILTTDMKRALITENYGVQKSLIILYPMKYETFASTFQCFTTL